MKKSWLVQRLQKPWKNVNRKSSNVFAFGGGLQNGGLSDKASELLADIFRFNYMGSAEFEFGALHEALDRIAKSREHFIATSVVVEGKPGKKVNVFVLCNSQDVDEITSNIEIWANNPRDLPTKDSVGLQRHLSGDEYVSDQCGWLELYNGYFFFTDKEMFDKTRILFGIPE